MRTVTKCELFITAPCFLTVTLLLAMVYQDQMISSWRHDQSSFGWLGTADRSSKKRLLLQIVISGSKTATTSLCHPERAGVLKIVLGIVQDPMRLT
jgi:hypothetical protein